jgi:hypothetical protein
MADNDPSTLWRISAFERLHAEGQAGAGLAEPSTMLPATLQAELNRLHAQPHSNDVLETMAACLRHHEAALLYMELPPYVWPVTLFPAQGLYHASRPVGDGMVVGNLGKLRLLSAERPGLRPPGHRMHERVAAPERYHPLPPLLWAVALHGPRATLLGEISGRLAYRLAPGGRGNQPAATGALGPSVERLRRQTSSLQDIARWPGMSLERACRLLNALYLTGGLMVMRSHAAARSEPLDWRRLLGRRR